MPSNTRPSKRPRNDVSQQAGASSVPEAGPSTVLGTNQGPRYDPQADLLELESRHYHLNSATLGQNEGISYGRFGAYVAPATNDAVSYPMNINDWGQSPAQPVFTPNEPPPNGYQDERRYHQHTQPTPLQQEAEHTEYSHLCLPNNGPHHDFEGAPVQTPGRQLRAQVSLSQVLDPVLWSETIAPAILQLAPSVAHSGEVQVNSAPGAPRGRKRKARDEDAEVAGEGGSAPLSAPSSRQMVLRTRKGKGKARDEDIGAAEGGSSAPQWVPSLPEPGQEQFERIPAHLKGKGKARDEATGAAAGSSSAATTSAPLPQGQHKVQDKAKRDKNAENASNQREVLRKEHVRLNEQLPDEYQDKRYPTAPLLGATRGAIRYISALEEQLERDRKRHQEEVNLLVDRIQAYEQEFEATASERDTLRSEKEEMIEEMKQLKRKVEESKRR